MRVLLVSDSKGFGGVAKATDSLHQTFITRKINSQCLYIDNGACGFVQSYFRLLSLYRYNNILILMHFKAILLGVFFFGKTKKINVIHTDLVGFYQSCNCLKKIILKLLIFFIKNSRIVFVSKEAEERARQYFNLTNTTCIYNIMDITTSNIIKNNHKNFRLGCIARLHKSKNIDVLLKVFNEQIKLMPNIRLEIFGDGEEFDRLKKFSEDLGISGSINFHGYVNDHSIIYNGIDALVSFSSIEGFGLTILEALCYEKPIVHTACHCGPSELLEPTSTSIIKINRNYRHTKFGFLVEPCKEHIPYLIELNSQELRYVEALNDFISYYRDNKPEIYDLSPFSSNKVVDNWNELFIRGNNV